MENSHLLLDAFRKKHVQIDTDLVLLIKNLPTYSIIVMLDNSFVYVQRLPSVILLFDYLCQNYFLKIGHTVIVNLRFSKLLKSNTKKLKYELYLQLVSGESIYIGKYSKSLFSNDNQIFTKSFRENKKINVDKKNVVSDEKTK
jgi:hypothetical protein